VKITRESTLEDVLLAVGRALDDRGIRAVLTGGGCATIYSGGRSVSKDLDFILETRVRQQDLDAALTSAGFHREGDRYVTEASPYWIEFPRGPLAIGGDHNVRPRLIRKRTGTALVLSATDACRDRLAAFYHWSDLQSLRVAVEIALRNRVNWQTIRSWSEAEGHLERFAEFRREVSSRRRRRRDATGGRTESLGRRAKRR